MLGLPLNNTVLFSARTRRDLRLSLAGSVVLSLLDLAGVLATLPLIQLATGVSPDSGALGVLSDLLGNPSSSQLALSVAGGMVAAFALKSALSIAIRWWQLSFMSRQEVAISTRLLRGYLGAPYATQSKRNTAELIRTMQDSVTQAYTIGVVGSLAVATEFFTVIMLCLGMMVVAPLMTLAAFVYFGGVMFLLQTRVKARVTRAGNVMVERSGVAVKAAMQAFGANKEIKIRHLERTFVASYEEPRLELAAERRTAVFLSELPKYVLELVFVLGIALLAGVLFSTTSQSEALVSLGLFIAAGGRLLPSSVRMLASLGNVRFGAPSLKLLEREVLAHPDLAPDVPESQIPDQPIRDVRIRDLTFSYDGEHNVLEGISVTMRQGTSVALVGPSGGGKSTFVDLLLGLLEPTSGSVHNGDLDVFDHLIAWQRKIATVPQDVYLLDDTLRANIAFGVPTAEIDEDLLARSVQKAQIQDLVTSLPDGLDAVVGERGGRISGGQRQRIGVARALYRNPELLVLDEATSALDNETESKITETIAGLHGTMTTVIVAHRLSTVRHCDQVLFLQGGKVAASGSFEEVRASNADFARLVELGRLD